MNGLLRHTGNVHRGMSSRSSQYSYLGTVWSNIKAGFIFVGNGFTTVGSAVIGLIRNIKL
jgi:hypothetical protein